MIYVFLTVSTACAFVLWAMLHASRAQLRGLEKNVWRQNKIIFDNESKLMAQKSQLANAIDKLNTFQNLYNDVQTKYEDLVLKENAIREKNRMKKAAQRAKKREGGK
jgi:DNA-binding protein H-NS